MASMTTTLDATRRAFMADILVHPDEDFYRLVFADWLEEHGGEPERAEFIRTQIEIASLANHDAGGYVNSCVWCKRRGELQRRERELLMSHYIEWMEDDLGGLEDSVCWEEATIAYRRGFYTRLACTCDFFMDHAASLFATAPVEVVRLTDKRPAQSYGKWAFFNDNGMGCSQAREDLLPLRLWERLDAADSVDFQGQRVYGVKGWDDRQAALDALSAAACKYGRKLAGLGETLGQTAKVASRK